MSSSPDSANPKPVNMGLQLFPPPPRKRNPSKTSTRRKAMNPQSPDSAVERAASPSFISERGQSSTDGRQSALGERETPVERQPASNGRQTPQTERQASSNGRQTPQTDRGQYASSGRQTPQPQPFQSPPQAPAQVHLASEIPRSHTSFSDAPTLVRRNSNSSHTSGKDVQAGSSREDPMLHSIFPRYNPEIALEHQAYYPTQTSQTQIPQTAINRREYSPSVNGIGGQQSPMVIGSSPGKFAKGVQDEAIMEPSNNEEMKELWKVVNGWRVSSSEGRKFCLKMKSDPEEPTHTLSSATQPFYTLRLVPTSTSAQMTMMRHDPNKPAKGSNSPKLGGTSKTPNSMEVMATTLEETARRLPPNDGLVALLYPRAASDMVIDVVNKSARADSEQVIAAAERECGRLVWDEDSGKYYLVHPAISTPFVVSISSSPAWSKVEYTLEHAELPRNVVRLIRDGAGSGFLEVDTGVAAKIDCFYIVDVAICALMLVAIAEEKTRNVERFDAPPEISSPPLSSKRNSSAWQLPKVKAKKEKEVKIEEMEIDLESQSSMKATKEKKEKIPGFLGLLWMMFKCFFWTIAMFFKALAKCIIFISSCLTRSKK